MAFLDLDEALDELGYGGGREASYRELFGREDEGPVGFKLLGTSAWVPGLRPRGRPALDPETRIARQRERNRKYRRAWQDRQRIRKAEARRMMDAARESATARFVGELEKHEIREKAELACVGRYVYQGDSTTPDLGALLHGEEPHEKAARIDLAWWLTGCGWSADLVGRLLGRPPYMVLAWLLTRAPVPASQELAHDPDAVEKIAARAR